MPLSWTLALNQVNSESIGGPASELRLRDIALVLLRADDKSKVTVPMHSIQDSSSSSVALSLDEVSRTLIAPKVTELSPGEYFLDHFRGIYVDSVSERPQELELPIPNPFDSEGSDALKFKVIENKVSVLGRVAFESVFGVKQGKLTSQMRGELLETDRISSLVLERDLGWKSGEARNAVKASERVPDVRHVLLAQNANTSAVASSRLEDSRDEMRIGFGIEAPCDQSFRLKFVWKKETDPEDYASLIPVQESESCIDAKQKFFMQIALPKGNWNLAATEIISSKIEPGLEARVSKIEALKRPSPELSNYFGLSGENNGVGSLLLSHTSAEQVLKRKFDFPVEKMGIESGDIDKLHQKLFFLGTFSIEPVNLAAVSPKDSVQGSEPTKARQAWNVLLKKQFTTETLKKAFGVEEIWNPYVGTLISAKEKLGKVESVLQISAEAKKATALAPFVTEIRHDLTEAFARCIEQVEEADPLLVAQGTFRFRVKAKQKTGAVESLNIEPAKPAEALKFCFRREFDSFKFKTAVPAQFEAEMQLEAK